MTNSPTPSQGGWLEACGLSYLLRTLGLAINPANLGVVLCGILLTVFLGGLLDWLWKGSSSVDGQAVQRFAMARQLDRPYEHVSGDQGLFQTFRKHQVRSVMMILGSVIPPGMSLAGTVGGVHGMVQGVWWLASQYTLYFLVFTAGFLVIWSACGGVVCRLAAVQFARDERPPLSELMDFVRPRLIGGYLMAPCIPLVFVLLTVLLMVLGGVVLRIPVLGDLLAGVAFFLAILGGFVITLMLVGLAVGGHLFWPAVATEGADAFDSFSRGMAYAFTRPWKTVLYAFITIALAAVCWMVVTLLTYLTLIVTRGVVAFGTSPFGWWSRSAEGSQSKLSFLWPQPTPEAMYTWPDWSQLSWYECVSGFLIGVYVLLVLGLMWSFLVSFYFCGSTVIYCLLRRDVDGVDVHDVYSSEDDAQASATGNAPAALPVESSSPGGGSPDAGSPGTTDDHSSPKDGPGSGDATE